MDKEYQFYGKVKNNNGTWRTHYFGKGCLIEGTSYEGIRGGFYAIYKSINFDQRPFVCLVAEAVSEWIIPDLIKGVTDIHQLLQLPQTIELKGLYTNGAKGYTYPGSEKAFIIKIPSSDSND